MAGIPVRSTRGPAGGYRLDGGYRTRLTGVGLDEAGALAFLGLSGPAQQLGLGDMLEGARTKILASLTGEARQRAGRTEERFSPIRPVGTARPSRCRACLRSPRRSGAIAGCGWSTCPAGGRRPGRSLRSGWSSPAVTGTWWPSATSGCAPTGCPGCGPWTCSTSR